MRHWLLACSATLTAAIVAVSLTAVPVAGHAPAGEGDTWALPRTPDG